MLDFNTSSPDDFRDFGRHLWQITRDFGTHEQTSQFIARNFYEECCNQDEDSCLALVRIYRLTSVEDLPPNLQGMVSRDETQVFALTGSYGLEDAWCDRRQSVRHQVIPLSAIADPEGHSMFQEMLRLMQVDMDRLYSRHELIGGATMKNHLYVPQVLGYSAISDQSSFVRPYEIQSMLGFGGFISGSRGERSMYLMFMFSRHPIPPLAVEKTAGLPEFIGAALASREGQHGIFDD